MAYISLLLFFSLKNIDNGHSMRLFQTPQSKFAVEIRKDFTSENTKGMQREHVEKEFYLYLLEALNKYSCVCKKKQKKTKKKKKILKVNVYTCKEINLIEELPTNYRTIHN